MKFSRRTLAIAAASGIVALAGCSGTSGGTVGAPQGAEHQIALAVVPGQDIGLIYVPEVQKIFKDQGISLNVTEIVGSDSVEGVVSKKYDLAYSSYVPPILALSEGASLKVISGLSNLGPAGSNGSTLVRKDSGITKWAELAGKSVATQSDKSISSLAVQAAILKDGGESAAPAKIVPTPNGKVAAVLAASEVDAGDLVQPYASAALGNYSDLTDIGDAKEYVLGENTPLTAFFTSTETAKAKEAAFTAFRTALDKAVEFGNANPEAVKKGSAGQAGLSEKVALGLPTSVFASSATAEELEPVVSLLVKMKWITKAPDLSDFAAG